RDAAAVAVLIRDERVIRAVGVRQRRQRARTGVGDRGGLPPQRLLFRQGQAVAVVVAVGVREQRVRVRPLARVRDRLVRLLIVVVVEVDRRGVLVAVLDAVAVSVRV